MIPKIIHYCWFGGKPLTELALKCIESWKKFCPDYEIKQWNEENYDVTVCDYIKEAYESEKWAFVSDYARFDILYRHGGIYFDTDVELIKPIDDLIENGPFSGVEDIFEKGADKESGYMVAAGLGMAAYPGMNLLNDVLSFYKNEHFINDDGSLNQNTVVHIFTDILKKKGFSGENKIQCIDGLTVYPAEFMCPMNYVTGNIVITQNTRSIHHYSMSWKNDYQKKLRRMERLFRQKLGNRMGYILFKILSFPNRVVHKIKVMFNINSEK